MIRRFWPPPICPRRFELIAGARIKSVPENEGAVIRCALESIALQYRRVLGWLEDLIGGRIETVHIVGGGTQNRQLCQMAADACQRRVVAGPVEATAIGNLMMQAIAAGEVGSIAEAREVIRTSFPVEEYQPQNSAAWDEAYQRFLQVCRRRIPFADGVRIGGQSGKGFPSYSLTLACSAVPPVVSARC